MSSITGLSTYDLLVEFENTRKELHEFDNHIRLSREEQEEVRCWERYYDELTDEIVRREAEAGQ